MNNLIIVINAPMNSGKDEIAKHFADKFGCYHMEVKELLFEAAVRAAGISRKLWDALYEREYKEIPSPYLRINGYDVSPREWMIHISENVMKPLFGNSVFGDAAAQKIRKLRESGTIKPGQTIVFSDGGFKEEISSISGVADNFFLARVHRIGANGEVYDWGTDSRRYVYLEEGVKGSEKDFDNHEGKLLSCALDIWEWANGIQGEELPF